MPKTPSATDGGPGAVTPTAGEITHARQWAEAPLIALQFWKGGDWLGAQNVWRRWFIAHNLRSPGAVIITYEKSS